MNNWNGYSRQVAPTANGPLLMSKLKNAIKRIDPTLEYVGFRNISVNGVNFGCSGFVRNPLNGLIVYVNTDHNHGTRMDNALYRYAASTSDYTGEFNHFARYADLPQAVVNMLQGRSPQNATREALARRSRFGTP